VHRIGENSVCAESVEALYEYVYMNSAEYLKFQILNSAAPEFNITVSLYSVSVA